MTTRVDLATQTQGVLSRAHGGNDNTAGYAHSQLIIPFLNDSGATLGIGDVVTRRAADPRLATSVVTDEKVMGVIVGRYSSTGTFQATNPAAGDTAAICVVGVCVVNTASAAVRGNYLGPGAAGTAAPHTLKQNASFGYVLYTMSSSKVQALIGQMEGDRVDLGPWFDVKQYGAVGDGSTVDTTAVNAAIAALNAAGSGVLYFPAGTYKTAGALTTISVPCLVIGDGRYTASSGAVSVVTCTSTTATLFTVSANGCTFRDLAMINATTTTAGAAITTTGGILARFQSILISGFFTGVDLENSNAWSMTGVYMEGIRKYGVRVRNTSTPDAGDWSISDSVIVTGNTADAAIQVESSGGGKITNVKINGLTGSNRFTTGINVSMATGVVTSVLLIHGVSIENVAGDAILVTTAGTGIYQSIAITGCQVGLISNNSGRAVKLNAAATGTGAGSIAAVTIDGCVFTTTGTARAAVEIVKADNITLGDYTLVGFNARYTSSGGATNIYDNGTAVPAFATPAIVLGTAAAAGAASTVIRSDSTIVAFDTTAPVTQLYSDTAATGSAAVAARRDHVHGMPASSAGTLSFSGCLVTHSGPQNLTNGSYVILSMDTETYDNGGYHYTSAANLTGTAAKNGTTAVVGTGTSFTTELSVGQIIMIPGTANERRVVSVITDNTHLTVSTAFTNTATGQTVARVNSGVVAMTAGYYLISFWGAMSASPGVGSWWAICKNATVAGNGIIAVGPVPNDSVEGEGGVHMVAQLSQYDFIEIHGRVGATTRSALQNSYGPFLSFTLLGT